MTPDDPVGSAVRRTLYRFALRDAIVLRPWSEIRALGRRIRRRRIATGVVGIAVVLTGAGAANVLAACGGHATKVRSVGTEPTSSASTTTGTTAPGSTTAPVAPTGAPTTVGTPPVGGPELVGSITVAEPMLVAEQPATVVLTIRNTTDHVWHDDIQPPVHLAVLMAPLEHAGVCADAQPADFTIGPHEQRTYSMQLTPNRHMLGPNTVSAVFLYDGTGNSSCLGGDAPDGVPSVGVTVVPPGWSNGQPLDPAQGRWDPTVDVGSRTEVPAGETVVVRAGVRNVGAHDQSTNGFGTLALVCRGFAPDRVTPWQRGRLFDPAVLPPGHEQTVSMAVTLDNVLGTVACEVQMAFHRDLAQAEWNAGLGTSIDSFEVVAPTTATVTP